MRSEELAFFALISLFMALALLCKLFPPKRINALYGYRTNRSMSSPEMWAKANALFPGFLLKLNAALSVTLVLCFFLLGFSTVLFLVALISFVGALIAAIVLTEIKLKQP